MNRPSAALGDLKALAARCGIEWAYHDTTGHLHDAEPEVAMRALRALGVPIDRIGEATAALAALDAGTPAPVARAIVAWDGRLPDTAGHGRGTITDVAGTELDPGRPLPPGVHTLHPGGGEPRPVLSAPRRGARGRPGGGTPSVAVFAPAYGLHRGGEPIGNLGALDALGAWAAGGGADAVVTLPLLAAVGDEVSPYLPSSRQVFDELWIDPVAAGTGPLRPVAASTRTVDPPAARAELRARLAALVARADPARDRAVTGFVTAHPVIAEYARFRALALRHGTDWRRWPTDARPDPDEERLQHIAQWILHTQLQSLGEAFARRDQVLALDLPLGTHPDGFDVWRRPDEFVPGFAVGAPPDAFSPRGQCWGFPPPHPATPARNGYGELRGALAAHLGVARVLRIDHVMGLQRLFWVPDGGDPSDGIYVRMPMEHLFAIICIAAAQHHADVYGEDLGTVTDEIRTAMDRHGMRRSYVAQFGFGGAGERLNDVLTAPVDSIASIGTHDLPSFAGWWDETDIDERVALGLLGTADAEATRADRARDRARLAALVGLDAAAEPWAAARDAVHTALAEGPAGTVVIALDDLLGERASQNVPGTSTERSNWRLRTPMAIDELPPPHLPTRIAPPRPELTATPGAPAGLATLLGDDDLHLFNEGRHFTLHQRLGAHPATRHGVAGTAFAVWAPNAETVSVVGDFNDWSGDTDPLTPRGDSGIWEGFVPTVGSGALYKFRLRTRDGRELDKADPFAAAAECPPATASRVFESRYAWRDHEWLAARARCAPHAEPVSIYEVHLGSWMRAPDGTFLGYRELAPRLAEHVRRCGFTHVELLPVMEHPFYGSWGYQVTGFFAPTARYGTPDDFRAFVDHLHGEGIGVILDWVPSHFPADAFALAEFDGTHLFEHADPRQRVHPDWQSWIFNYGRNEVRSFLVSNARHWCDEFHIDGLRVDAVASMLYLDYSRAEGEWVPNRFGGNENLEAISLLQDVNAAVYGAHPGVMVIAEESTAWPGVTRAAHDGGLGFGFKWDMGWMHDTLAYLGHDPVHRRHHHDELTFRSLYAGSENYVLALSHDEVVHGKGTLLSRMPGDDWQQFANLRLLFGYQWMLNGKKLLFMGSELATRAEWDHDGALDWNLLSSEAHRGVLTWLAHLNHLYRTVPALHAGDCDPHGFEWIDCSDRDHSVVAFERRAPHAPSVVVAANFTPVPRAGYRIGLPVGGTWRVIANGDAPEFWGSGCASTSAYRAEPIPWQDRAHSAAVDLPPLAIVALMPAAHEDPA